jgi:hypothetical protein
MSRTAECLLPALSALVVLFSAAAAEEQPAWSVSALPPSVRLDPSSGRFLDSRPDIYRMKPFGDLLKSNWIYDGGAVEIKAARGEYVSFQVVLERKTMEPLKDITVGMTPFTMSDFRLGAAPELFLEWAVQVKSVSTGYEKSSLGPGWYPDALVPLSQIQMNVSQMSRLSYPLELPDFWNRVDNQRFLVVWVDQFVPFERVSAAPGVYTSEVSVSAGGRTVKLPVRLKVWNFAVPLENRLAGNLQHEGFLRGLDERQELAIYQLFKRHRVVPADPTYVPRIAVSPDGAVKIDWTAFDQRLGKYFTGEAFTGKYGYSGPGYGEPIEQFVLPFDVYGKHGTPGWPDIGKPEVEREPARQAIYVEAIRQVREHMLKMVNPEKTRLIVYLNGLDESYFPEAWDRMDYYGKLFHKNFPEVKFRVDGSYSREAMEVIHEALDYWCCHTIGYDIRTIEEYRKLGVKDWLYGPMLYEREENGWCGSSTFLDLALVNERAISWACWKYRTLTWCSWGMASGWRYAWFNSETFKDCFRDGGKGPLSFRSYNGNAMAIYSPGIVPDINLACPSLRLKAMRDGVQEYEYMRLLSGLDGNPARADSIVNRIVRQPFGKASIGELNIWSYDPAQWDAARVEMGEMLDKVYSKK